MKIRIQRISDVPLPKYAHPGDAGLDIYSAEDVTLKPGETKLVKTGVKMAIPEGYVGLIWDKSGFAAKNSIHVLAGVVDSGYRGEICIVLKNLGNEDFAVVKNKKVAQMLIQPIASPDIEELDSLDQTSRNEGGFGSTGIH